MKFLRRFVLLVLATVGVFYFLIANPMLVKSHAGAEAVVLADSLKAHVEFLCSTPKPRNFRNLESLNIAADYIEQEYSRFSERVQRQAFESKGHTYYNIICSFGPDTAERLIVGAHYDVCYEQPGADDNASGVAGLLEIARALSTRSDLAYRIDLVAYSLEEPPYFRTFDMGSAVHARYCHQNQLPVKAMISLEMIGYFSDEPHSQDYPVGVLKAVYPSTGNYIAIVGKLGDSRLSRQVKRLMRRSGELPIESINAPASMPGIDFSDHLNYWLYHYEAIMITNTAFYRNRNYHQITDTPETLNYEKMAEVVEGVIYVLTHFK
jgi:hypothetical protein